MKERRGFEKNGEKSTYIQDLVVMSNKDTQTNEKQKRG
jgi:hypothetical protein